MLGQDLYSSELHAEYSAEIIRKYFNKHYAYLSEDLTIAELGCGPGLLLRQLAILFPKARLLGIDIDPSAVQAAMERDQTALISQGSFTQTPWGDNSVDIVTSSQIYDYSEDGIFPNTYNLSALAEELRRILTPGGVFIPVSGDYRFTYKPQSLKIFEKCGFNIINKTNLTKPYYIATTNR